MPSLRNPTGLTSSSPTVISGNSAERPRGETRVPQRPQQRQPLSSSQRSYTANSPTTAPPVSGLKEFLLTTFQRPQALAKSTTAFSKGQVNNSPLASSQPKKSEVEPTQQRVRSLSHPVEYKPGDMKDDSSSSNYNNPYNTDNDDGSELVFYPREDVDDGLLVIPDLPKPTCTSSPAQN